MLVPLCRSYTRPEVLAASARQRHLPRARPWLPARQRTLGLCSCRSSSRAKEQRTRQVCLVTALRIAHKGRHKNRHQKVLICWLSKSPVGPLAESARCGSLRPAPHHQCTPTYAASASMVVSQHLRRPMRAALSQRPPARPGRARRPRPPRRPATGCHRRMARRRSHLRTHLHNTCLNKNKSVLLECCPSQLVRTRAIERAVTCTYHNLAEDYCSQ